jgi:hypothetical protein
VKIAIMQPYFIPYAGYFRLLSATDMFVVYDCVQFPRRGWVHRNQLLNYTGKLEWLTLPLQKQSMDITIQDLLFRDNAAAEWIPQLEYFPAFKKIRRSYPNLHDVLSDLNCSPLEYIVKCMREVCQIIDVPFNVQYSSALRIPKDVRGQDRILEIVKYFDAKDYINAPGGRDLYDSAVFSSQGINLHFLPAYNGEFYSIIESLSEMGPVEVRRTLDSQIGLLQ